MVKRTKGRNLLYYTIVEIVDEKQNPIESMCCYFGLDKTNKKKERNIHYHIPQCQNFLEFHSFSPCNRCLRRAAIKWRHRIFLSRLLLNFKLCTPDLSYELFFLLIKR